jgi:hypothetical protein
MLSRYWNIARHLAGAVLALGSSLVLGAGSSKAALSITASTDAAAMAEALIGPGVKLVPNSAEYAGAPIASGFFSGDKSIFGNPAGVSGVILTSGSAEYAEPPNDEPNKSQENFLLGTDYLDGIAGSPTLDASTLTFRIKLDPGKDEIEWKYVFGSEEYPEFVGQQFNDVFALSLNGENLALIPSTTDSVSINNVNLNKNSDFFRDNPIATNPIATQYDGLTTVLTARKTGLTPGVEYTLSFAIADVGGDFIYDSGVFLLRGSIRGPVNAVPGPLPLLGAGAALVWSRRLRSRINERVRSR